MFHEAFYLNFGRRWRELPFLQSYIEAHGSIPDVLLWWPYNVLDDRMSVLVSAKHGDLLKDMQVCVCVHA